jgi:hypothetical protein
MAITLRTTGTNQVLYWERPDGASENWTPEGSECVRRLACQWKDRIKFRDDILGTTLPGYDGTTGKLRREIPDQHPWFTGMWAVGMSLADKQGYHNQDSAGRMTMDQAADVGTRLPAGQGDGTGYAVYDVRYRRPNFSINSDQNAATELSRYCVRTGRSSTESMTIPGQAYQWGAAGDAGEPGAPTGAAIPTVVPAFAGSPLTGDTTIALAGGEFCIEWLMVPQVNWAKIKAALLAPVNSTAFDTAYGNWPAQTLFLRSVEYTPAQHATGLFFWTHKFTWLYKPTGWNKIYSRAHQDFFKVIDRKTATKGIFLTSDHHELFKFV